MAEDQAYGGRRDGSGDRGWRGAGRNDLDMAVGLVVGLHAPTVFVNNLPVVVVGDVVAPHHRHKQQVMVTGSPNVFAHSIPTCREGDVATCKHPLIVNSPDVFIN